MLTNITNNPIISGYPGQQIQQPQNAVSGLESSADRERQGADEVKISGEARALQRVYDEKERTLEENYSNEQAQLEREYLQEKRELEQEFKQKRQSLGVNIYA